jgi:siroheme synthase-like protein
MSPLFPVFLKLSGRAVVVVGGGAVACAKLPELIRAGARVTVVAPEIRPEVASSGASVIQRGFVPTDLDGAWLVVAAAPTAVNREVAAAADERRVFVNAVDDAGNGSAYTAGVIRKGGVTIAISTEGRAPALAGLLREGLEPLVPDEIETWVAEAARLREQQRAARLPLADRRPALLRTLNRLYESRGRAPFGAAR